ncbi:MAG: hypothetical protein PGN26_08980 [Xylophilus ampelinus]
MLNEKSVFSLDPMIDSKKRPQGARGGVIESAMPRRLRVSLPMRKNPCAARPFPPEPSETSAA